MIISGVGGPELRLSSTDSLTVGQDTKYSAVGERTEVIYVREFLRRALTASTPVVFTGVPARWRYGAVPG